MNDSIDGTCGVTLGEEPFRHEKVTRHLPQKGRARYMLPNNREIAQAVEQSPGNFTQNGERGIAAVKTHVKEGLLLLLLVGRHLALLDWPAALACIKKKKEKRKRDR